MTSDREGLNVAVEKDAKGWPILRSAQDMDCDGENPMTGRPCVNGRHVGYHRDEFGGEWLDDGEPAERPYPPYDPRD